MHWSARGSWHLLPAAGDEPRPYAGCAGRPPGEAPRPRPPRGCAGHPECGRPLSSPSGGRDLAANRRGGGGCGGDVGASSPASAVRRLRAAPGAGSFGVSTREGLGAGPGAAHAPAIWPLAPGSRLSDRQALLRRGRGRGAGDPGSVGPTVPLDPGGGTHPARASGLVPFRPQGFGSARVSSEGTP